MKKLILKEYVNEEYKLTETLDPYFDFGFSKFGPFLLGFVHWLNKQVSLLNVDKIFFLARDGFLMKKAFEIISDENARTVSYFYCSRKSLRLSLLWKYNSYEDSIRYMNKTKYVSIANLLDYYGFNEKEIIAICDEEDLDKSRIIPWSEVVNDEIFIKVYEQQKEKIRNRSKKQDELLLRYFSQERFDGKCVLVDIGWHDSMQFYIEEFNKMHKRKTEINGLYLGTYSQYKLSGTSNGYLFSGTNQLFRKRVLCFYGVLEKCFQSREGSTIGYVEKDNEVVPMLLDYEYLDDAFIVKKIKQLQYGALEYVRAAHKGKIKNKTLESYKGLLRFGMYPTVRDVDLFSFFYNYEGQRDYFTAQKKLFQYKPDEFIHALNFSPWKTGFMKSVFKLPFPYYWIYKVMS